MTPGATRGDISATPGRATPRPRWLPIASARRAAHSVTRRVCRGPRSYQLKHGVRKPMLGLCIGGNAQEPDIEAREVAPPPADTAYAHESTSARVGARTGAPCRVRYQAASPAHTCRSGHQWAPHGRYTLQCSTRPLGTSRSSARYRRVPPGPHYPEYPSDTRLVPRCAKYPRYREYPQYPALWCPYACARVRIRACVCARVQVFNLSSECTVSSHSACRPAFRAFGINTDVYYAKPDIEKVLLLLSRLL